MMEIEERYSIMNMAIYDGALEGEEPSLQIWRTNGVSNT